MTDSQLLTSMASQPHSRVVDEPDFTQIHVKDNFEV